MKHQPYDEEFKIRAVEMIRKSGKSAKQIARELGCSSSALSDWKRRYDDPLKDCLDPENASIEQLRKENARLLKELNLVTEQREILKKQPPFWVNNLLRSLQLHQENACRRPFHRLSLHLVSQSGYFASINRPESQRQQRRNRLTAMIKDTHRHHRQRYGRPRIYQHLKSQGLNVSEKMVGSILRNESLKARRKRPFRPRTTVPGKPPRYAPNLLKSMPPPSRPNQILVSDTTYVSTQEGWLYLAAIMDLKTRKICGYQLMETHTTELVSTALHKALRKYPTLRGAVLHSDRGCQIHKSCLSSPTSELLDSMLYERPRSLL